MKQYLVKLLLLFILICSSSRVRAQVPPYGWVPSPSNMKVEITPDLYSPDSGYMQSISSGQPQQANIIRINDYIGDLTRVNDINIVNVSGNDFFNNPPPNY